MSVTPGAEITLTSDFKFQIYKQKFTGFSLNEAGAAQKSIPDMSARSCFREACAIPRGVKTDGFNDAVDSRTALLSWAPVRRTNYACGEDSCQPSEKRRQGPQPEYCQPRRNSGRPQPSRRVAADHEPRLPRQSALDHDDGMGGRVIVLTVYGRGISWTAEELRAWSFKRFRVRQPAAHKH
jgi:hypothetical protein